MTKPFCERNYEQPHNIKIPSSGNLALDDKLIEKSHRSQKQKSRQKRAKRNSGENKVGKLKGYKNGISRGEYKIKKILNSIQRAYPLEDSYGKLIPYCSYPPHLGVIGAERFFNNGRICLECKHLVIYRPSKKRYNL